MAQKLFTTLPGLSKQQAKWVELVCQGEDDWKAYLKVYKCKESTARSNAYMLRKKPWIRQALIKVQAAVERLYLEALAPATKKGRLCRIMMEGSDADAIRAIKELNDMERDERELGGGQASEFDELVLMIARRRRVLPFQDREDQEVIELEKLPR